MDYRPSMHCKPTDQIHDHTCREQQSCISLSLLQMLFVKLEKLWVESVLPFCLGTTTIEKKGMKKRVVNRTQGCTCIQYLMS